MARKYEKVQELLPLIKARLAEGKTQTYTGGLFLCCPHNLGRFSSQCPGRVFFYHALCAFSYFHPFKALSFERERKREGTERSFRHAWRKRSGVSFL